MIIQSSDLRLQADHQLQQKSESRESLRTWGPGGEARGTREAGASQPPGQSPGRAGTLSLAQAFFQATRVELSSTSVQLQPQPARLDAEKAGDGQSPEARFEITLLQLLVERMTGKRIELFQANDLATGGQQEMAGDSAGATSANPPAVQGPGLEYDYYASYRETESLHFEVSGKVLTADGQELDISIELNMSRSFFSEQAVHIEAGPPRKDPLVINFDGRGAELTQGRFAFDIDADGRSDQVRFVGSGSGFLALDRNRDGEINDGSELFGARTGDGFAELSAFDEDGNGWIDSADSIYDRLRVWSQDGEGNRSLVALGQRGVGALYLGRIETPFLLKDSDNQTQGEVRSSGLYLGEEGGAGVLQQINLVV